MTQLIPASFNCTGLFISVSFVQLPPVDQENWIPDFTCECSRLLQVRVLRCNLNAILDRFLQKEEIDARRRDHDICGPQMPTIRINNSHQIDLLTNVWIKFGLVQSSHQLG